MSYSPKNNLVQSFTFLLVLHCRVCDFNWMIKINDFNHDLAEF